MRSTAEAEAQAMNALRRGDLVDCSQQEYHAGVRSAIQRWAGGQIDMGQDVYALIALNEVRRLDALYGWQKGGEGLNARPTH